MGSIRRHRNAMTALLAEYNDKFSNALDTSEDFDDYVVAKRREDNDIQGGLCQSVVRYARPQKARSASGEWKYIVNTGQHTQTLRMEKCLNPQESCSYLSTSYRSHCGQVYNYHRLLSWDKARGLHVDIFKVPTCCSCEIDGYKQQFPALANKDFTPMHKGELYRQRNQQLDYNDEEEDAEDDFEFSIQHEHHKYDSSFDANELSSNRLKSKNPSPTVGSFLSPPLNEAYEQQYGYKTPRDTASASSHPQGSLSSLSQLSVKDLQRRRPQKSYDESRTDLEYSPSEQHAEREVNDFGTTIAKDESTHQKSKNVYSVTHTANTSSSGISDSSTASVPASTGTIRAFKTTSTLQHRRPTLLNTNAHQKPSRGIPSATAATSSLPAAATTGAATTTPSTQHTNGAASLPTHYYTRARHVLKNQSRLRIPYTITSANKRSESGSKSQTTPSNEFELEHEDPTTVATSSSSQQPDIFAVNPEIFKKHYKSKFNITYTTTPTYTTPSSIYPLSPKRINYSYHPIIDFFEYNRRVTASPTAMTPPSTVAETDNISSSIHKSHNSFPTHKHKSTAKHDYQQQLQNKQQLNHRLLHRERRIGYGAAAAVAAATDGGGSSHSIRSRSESSGVVLNSPQQKNTNSHNNSGKNLYSMLLSTLAPPTSGEIKYSPSVQTDIWHPVVVSNY